MIFIIYNIQDDIPEDLYKLDWTSKQVLKCWNFSKVWRLLESAGWKWTRGRGLVSYYYIRPNRQVQPPFVAGSDYFESEDEVIDYVVKMVNKSQSRKVSNQKSSQNYKRLKKLSKKYSPTNDDNENGEQIFFSFFVVCLFVSFFCLFVFFFY